MIGVDFDGVVGNYANHTTEMRFNPHLPAMLPSVVLVAIISNQGGVNFSQQDPTKYPTAETVARRFAAGVEFLGEHRLYVAEIHVSVFHPRASLARIAATARRLRRALEQQPALSDVALHIYCSERARKPQPWMLRRAGVSVYYGDSPEDEDAAEAAGVPFVHVPRFE